MKLTIKLTNFRLHKKLVEKLSVPIPTTDFEIGGNLEIERFESHTPGWACNGQPDEIGFTVNKPVQLYSIGLFGSCISSSVTYYQVEIDVREEKTGRLLGSQSGNYECSGAGPYMVVFRNPITLAPKTTYVITARVKGPDSYKGIKGRQCVETKLLNGKKLRVEFSNVYGTKNTTFKWGQIPMLVFS
uniref:PHR domain-containing protein n=1 Tax=Acrobeloides nanus TaxID=290746 RepID=A0A914E383_9BILA